MKNKSKVTDYMDYCIFHKYTPADHVHHLIGGSNRQLSEKYGLTIPVCARCHTSGEKLEDSIHNNPRAEDLSKMLGQAIWEKNYYKDLWYQLNRGEDEARERFIEIFGQSYI